MRSAFHQSTKVTFRWEQDGAGGEHGMATYFVGTPNEVSLRIDTFAEAHKLDRAIGHALDQQRHWSPLTDDGDALRLACDLGLRVFPIARTQSGAACSAVGHATGERLSEVADASLDTHTATRRAIVLAAAEIGKQIKGGQHGAE